LLNSARQDVAVVSAPREPKYSVDGERLAKLIAAASAILDSDRTTAKAYIQQAVEVLRYEKECFSKRGGRMPRLDGAANFEGNSKEGVSFPIDLTNGSLAVMEAQERERRYREVGMTLAHADRIATLGQMSASIAHEINQPVAATVTNAQGQILNPG
jgi:signal transduction histidine kinase